MNAYVPILGLMALAALFLGVSIFASVNIGPARYNKAKYDTYECGIEIVFLYPWAVAFNQLGVFAFVEMLLFVVTVIIAYIYVVRRGGLTWE